MKNSKDIVLLTGIFILTVLMFVISLVIGEVDIHFSDILGIIGGEAVENGSWPYIFESRLNRAFVAVLSGGALALSGLILQVFFRNPLAGPGVLGISSGASLGVALVVLGGVGLSGFSGYLATVISGFIGAFLVLLLLLLVSKYVKQAVVLLVLGLMLSYFTSAILNILYQWATAETTREFVVWGLGSFDGLNQAQVIIFSILIGSGLLGSFSLIKPLNGLSLGPEYAQSLGINIRQVKWIIIIITGVLTAIVTVFCGPIGFLGIAVPQLTRIITKSRNHALIIPFTFILGSFLALGADITIRALGNNIPLNTATALIGSPIIIWTIFKMNKSMY